MKYETTESSSSSLFSLPEGDPEAKRLGTTDYYAFNPEGRVPVLLTDDGRQLTQSSAIVGYLDSQSRGPVHLLPEDPWRRAEVEQITSIVACDIHPLQNRPMIDAAVRDFGMVAAPVETHPFRRRFIRRGFAALEAILERKVGQFSVGDSVSKADVFLVPQVRNALGCGVDVEAEFPRVYGVFSRCLDRVVAFREVLEESGGVRQPASKRAAEAPATGVQQLQLIGSEHSYFTGKARAHLRWKGVDFKEALCTREVYKRVVLPKVGWPVAPVLVVLPPGQSCYVQDTSDIIDEVERLYPELNPLHPRPTGAASVNEVLDFLFELLADQHLILPAMHYRWQFPEQQGFLEHEWGSMTDPDKPLPGRLKSARRSMKQFASAATMIGATPETAGAIERSFKTLLDLLSAHFERHDFVLGESCLLHAAPHFRPLFV